MKKFFALLLLIVAIIIPNVKAADLTSNFTVTSVKFCKDVDCTVEYNDTDKPLVANNKFRVALDWEYHGPAIKNGDTVVLNFGNETNTETTTIWNGTMNGVVLYDSNNNKIGTVKVTGEATSSHKLTITFSDNAVGKTDLEGNLYTTNNFSSGYSYQEITVPFTIGNSKYYIKLLPNSFNRNMSDKPEFITASASNTNMPFLLTTPHRTLYDLYTSQGQNISDSGKFQNIKCDISIPDGITSDNYLFYSRISAPTEINNPQSSGLNMFFKTTTSVFVKVTPNAGETKEQFKARLNKYEYGIITDNGNDYFVINFGNIPSEDYTYHELVGNEPGDDVYQRNPFSYNEDIKNIVNTSFGSNNIIDGKVVQWRVGAEFKYPPATVTTTKTVTSSCQWEDINGVLQNREMAATNTLSSGGGYAKINNASQLYLYDEDAKGDMPIQGARIKLEKTDGTYSETQVTDENGGVVFRNLSEGTYKYSQETYINHYVNGSYKAYSDEFVTPVTTFTVTESGNVIYATNKRQSYTITYLPGEHGTWEEGANGTRFTQLYNEDTKKPSSSEMPHDDNWDFNGWSPNPDGTKVTGNKTYTATWIKKIKITVRHEDQNGNLLPSNLNLTTRVIQGNTYGPYTADQTLLQTYDLVGGVPSNASGTAGTTDIEIVFKYKKKQGTLTVRHVDDETGSEISSVTTTHDYGYRYETNPITNNNYSLVTPSPSNAEGEINSPTTVVTYHYIKKTGTINIEYREKSTNNKIADDDSVTGKYGDSYTNQVSNKKSEKENSLTSYNYDSSNGKESGSYNKQTDTVIFYYIKKPSSLTIKYVNKDTNEVFDTKTENKKYGDSYTTSSENNKVPKNYKFDSVDSTKDPVSVASMNKDAYEVIYYYTKKPSSIVENPSKSGTAKITSSKDEVSYNIKYEYTVTDYIGTAHITLTDTLPYEIDEESSVLDGGTYDNKTITWTEEKTIDSYTNNKIVIEKNIKLVYKNIDLKGESLTNLVTGSLILDNNIKENITTTYTVLEEIKGSVTVIYTDEDGKELEKKIINGNAGDQISTEEKSFKGYVLKSKPETEVFELTEEEQIVEYKYEKIKHAVMINIKKGKGYVAGDEVVKYGYDSTKDNIVITAANGSYISKILIDGKEYKIEKEAKKVIIPNFKDMKEDHVIDVEFEYLSGLSENVPKTGNVLSIVWPILLISIVTISLFMVKLYTNKGKLKNVQ